MTEILVKRDRHLEDQSGTIECYQCASLLLVHREDFRSDCIGVACPNCAACIEKRFIVWGGHRRPPYTIGQAAEIITPEKKRRGAE